MKANSMINQKQLLNFDIFSIEIFFCKAVVEVN